jgi:hypothetical protein
MGSDQEFGRIAPADSAVILVQDAGFPATKGVYVGGTGNLEVLMANGSRVTFQNLQAGIVHPLRITYIFSAGTTATNIIGLR